MSLSHDFILIQPSQIDDLMSLRSVYAPDIRFGRFDKIPWPTDCKASKVEYELKLLTNYYKEHLHDGISVMDAYILPNIPAFEYVNTLMHGFIPYKGLNYYGFTLIPLDSIPCLIDTLCNLSHKNRFTQLIEFCEKAIRLQQHILHCGI